MAVALTCGVVLATAAGCFIDPGSSAVNRSNYARIHEGMTYGEVADLLGGPGHLMMRVTRGNRTVDYYEWVGVDDYKISVSFVNGVVAEKSSAGWGGSGKEEPVEIHFDKGAIVTEDATPSPGPAIAFADYERIRNGMAYADVVATFGCDGKAAGSRWIGKTELKVYEWRNAEGSYATIDFTKGRVCRKYQRGLK